MTWLQRFGQPLATNVVIWDSKSLNLLRLLGSTLFAAVNAAKESLLRQWREREREFAKCWLKLVPRRGCCGRNSSSRTNNDQNPLPTQNPVTTKFNLVSSRGHTAPPGDDIICRFMCAA